MIISNSLVLPNFSKGQSVCLTKFFNKKNFLWDEFHVHFFITLQFYFFNNNFEKKLFEIRWTKIPSKERKKSFSVHHHFVRLMVGSKSIKTSSLIYMSCICFALTSENLKNSIRTSHKPQHHPLTASLRSSTNRIENNNDDDFGYVTINIL